MIRFPQNFFWGASTSAYQVEGNNQNSDWWEWEKACGLKETSNQACRHYEMYKEDFDLAKALNHNSHRLSLEWSRIQPRRGSFSQDEIRHYQDVLLALKERGIEPVLTLHHFTNPAWFTKEVGWDNPGSVDLFLEYAGKLVETLADKVTYWVTINEPMVYLYYSYIDGSWPPQKRSFSSAHKVFNNLVKAHLKAYRLIHDIYKKKGLPSPMVSIAQNMQFFEPCNNSLKNKVALYLRDRFFNHRFIEIACFNKTLDYVGVNYYTRGLVEARGWSFEKLTNAGCTLGHSKLKKNYLGWDIYPQGLYKTLLSLKKYKLPVFILENGICTSDDIQRWEFISEHLKSVHKAMQEGVNVIGYIYWSLIDNYEWDKGFGPRFGLIDVDYNNFKRTPRNSAEKFASVCKTCVLNEDH